MNPMNSDHTPAIINPGQFSSQHISKSLRRLPGSSPRDNIHVVHNNIHNVQQTDSGLQRAPQFNTVQQYSKLRYIIQTSNIVRVTGNHLIDANKQNTAIRTTQQGKNKRLPIEHTAWFVKKYTSNTRKNTQNGSSTFKRPERNDCYLLNPNIHYFQSVFV